MFTLIMSVPLLNNPCSCSLCQYHCWTTHVHTHYVSTIAEQPILVLPTEVIYISLANTSSELPRSILVLPIGVFHTSLVNTSTELSRSILVLPIGVLHTSTEPPKSLLVLPIGDIHTSLANTSTELHMLILFVSIAVLNCWCSYKYFVSIGRKRCTVYDDGSNTWHCLQGVRTTRCTCTTRDCPNSWWPTSLTLSAACWWVSVQFKKL